ncbi:MAG: DUF928 domain-containing protein [Cyanobacteria bacterium J06639_14]
MTQRSTMCNFHICRQVIGFGSTISLLIFLGSASLAGYAPANNSSNRLSNSLQTTVGGSRAYTPPSDSRRSGEDHTGGGVRGCGEDVVALAPRLDFVGQSVSTRPTFVWYVFSDDGEPLEFHLYRYQADGSKEVVLINPIGPSEQGYMAYTLPPDQPDLGTGETYLWQVVAYCDENLEDTGAWTSADIEIVAPPANLATELPEAPLEKAQAYAGYGFWYEAMAAVYDAATPETQDFRQNLLLDLADLETPSEPGELSEDERELIEQLREIAAMP